MGFLDTQEFTIIEPPGIKVIAFMVRYAEVEMWGKQPICKLEELEYIENKIEGKLHKVFTILKESAKIDVVMLSLSKSRCVVGFGTYNNGQIEYKDNTMKLNYTNFKDLQEKQFDYKFNYEPKRQIILIDTQECKQVMPSFSKGKGEGELIGKYRLTANRNYVALRLVVAVHMEKNPKSLADEII